MTPRSPFRVLIGLVCLFAQTSSTRSAEPAAATPQQGLIQNLDSKPFSFRLARSKGVTWTDTITLAPGESLTLKPGADGNTKDIEGITGDGKGHVTIDYPELGGRIRLQLPAVNQRQQVSMPFWFHVRDSNGFSRLVQAESKAAAEARHKDMLAEPPLTPAELAAVRRMLKANFILTER